MRAILSGILLVLTTSLIAQTAPPLDSATGLAAYDAANRYIGNVFTVDVRNREAIVAFRLANGTAPIDDTVLLRYIWYDRSLGGTGSEWLSPNQGLAPDDIFFDRPNCAG